MTSLYQMPDGQDYEFSSDAEATKAMTAWNNQFKKDATDKKSSPVADALSYVVSTPGRIKDMYKGVAEAGLSMATGAGGMIAGGLSQAAASLYEGLHGADGTPGANPDAPHQYGQEVANSMTYEPRAESGKKIMDAISPIGVPFKAASDFLRKGEKSLTGGTTGTDVGLGVLSAGSPFLGGTNAGKISLAKKQAALDTIKSQNAATDAVITKGRDAGYKFTPDELSKFGAGHPAGSAIEDVAALHVYHLNREANAIDAKASIANYGNTIKKVREDLTMPNGKPVPNGMAISNGTLDQFIQQHGKIYAAVSSLKEPIVYTKTYEAAIKNIEGDLAAAKKQYPDLMKTDGVSTLQEALLSGKPSGAGIKYHGYETEYGMPYNVTTPASTNAAAAMQLIRKLRDDANRTFQMTEIKPEALALAKVQKKAANTLEELLGDHLENTGKTALFKAFKNSRTQIAKAYELKNALDGTVLSTAKLARNGEGLTGNLKTIQDMQLQHPNLMLDPRTISTSGGGVAANAFVGAGAAALGHPALGLAIAGRPLLGKMTLSKPYQQAFTKVPDYKVGAMQRMLSGASPYGVGLTSAQLQSGMFSKDENK